MKREEENKVGKKLAGKTRADVQNMRIWITEEDVEKNVKKIKRLFLYLFNPIRYEIKNIQP